MPLQVFGQLDLIPNDASSNLPSKQDASSFTIWIPSKMISGQDYEGMVVLDKPTNQPSIFYLSSSDISTLRVPLSVTVQPSENHGIFTITALKDGNATVFGALNGNLTQCDAMVYTSNSQPSKLQMIVPTHVTKAQDMQSYVFSEDKFGLPVSVDEDTEITVTTSSMITAPETVTIPKGQYYTTLPLITKGSGTISISSDTLGVATTNVTKTRDDITIKLAVAPYTALPNSLSYFYIWLEKDGMPFKPPYAIHASLTSSDTNVARFGNNYDVTHFSDMLYSTTIRDGVAKGFVYTRNVGSTVISASIDGFGVASASLIVGPSTNNQVTGKNITSYCDSFSSCKPNMVKIWVYPTTFDDSGYGIIGLYHEMNQSNTSTIIPLEADSSTVQLSSNGPETRYDKQISMIPTRIPGSNEEAGVAQAVEFGIQGGGTGNFTMAASGPGEIPGVATFNVKPRYSDSYSIKITPLPAKAGINQDLGIMYIADSTGAMIEPSNVFAVPPQVEIKSTINNMPKVLDFTSTNMILGGMLTAKSELVASIQGIQSSAISIVPLDVATNMEFELPPRVHVGEKFPYVVYKTDAFGVPLMRIIPRDVSTITGVDFDPSGRYIYVNQEGRVTIVILSEDGAIKQSITSFYNDMNVNTDANSTIFRVGKDNIFNISSDISDVTYKVQSIFPVIKKGDGEYSIIPSREQSFDVTIFAHKDGFRPVSETLHLVSKKIIDITMVAKGNDGTQLHINPKFTVSNYSIEQNTPFTTTVNAGNADMELPPKVILQNKNYVLHMIDIGNQRYTENNVQTYLEDDSYIIATYDLVLSVNATNAIGGGFYSYGSTVTLDAPEKWQVSFLVRQVFDHWNGNNLPFDSKTNDPSFVAKDSIFATAIYRPDYTYLMLVIAGPITGIFAMRKHSTISWYARELNDKLEKFIAKLHVQENLRT
ncbi:hypothetical protein [Candidatus Nitrosotalea okcheonensis]|uniref:hypothetical protein n=1 Tax=Candidatus Nitrosotalea okcheonensis TaxID=1903276 RepID=UPI0012FFE320|nr:hypothetical protein [Candidatus Nitrosotalea okcheonensis]